MMFFVSFISMLPALFNLTIDVTKLFDGTATPEEWDKVLNDINSTVVSIPQLSGFAVLISGATKVLEAAIPLIEAQVNAPKAGAINTSGGMMGLVDDSVPEITAEDLMKAKVSLRIGKSVNQHLDKYIANKAAENNQSVDEFVKTAFDSTTGR